MVTGSLLTAAPAKPRLARGRVDGDEREHGNRACGALFALVARALMPGAQTPISRWSEMYDRRARGRRVPDIKPDDW